MGAAGEVTQFEYAPDGQVTKVIRADGSTQQFTYDESGNLTTALDSKGPSVHFTYDVDGRVASTTDAGGNTTTYAYDPAGNVLSDVGPRGTTSFTYDGRNRPATITTPNARRHTFTYNGNDSVAVHHIERLKGDSSRTLAKTRNFYNRDGRLASSYTRDARGRTLATSSYRYDENGNPTRRKSAASDQQYAYDALNRITAVSYANRSGAMQTDTYTYNALGNRTAKNNQPYTYNAIGEVVSAPGAVTYSYDPQGRRTAKSSPAGTESYAYDSLGQMTSRTDEQGNLSTYTYDAQGRITQAASSALTRSYAYGVGDSPIQITSRQASTPGAPAHGQSTTRSQTLTYGPTGLIERALGDSAPSFPLKDNSGTITAELTAQGTLEAEPARDPFGALLPGESVPHPTGAVDDQTLAFAGAYGRPALPQSSLVQLGARTYDSQTGAFTTRDPVVGPAGEPARRVAYSFAFNGPARFSDLGGRSVFDDYLCNPIYSRTCYEAKQAIAPHAENAGDWYKSRLADPNQSAVEKAIAAAGLALSGMANCENFVDSGVSLAALGFGGIAAGSVTIGQKMAATVAALALKARTEEQMLAALTRLWPSINWLDKNQKAVDLVWKTVKALWRHLPK